MASRQQLKDEFLACIICHEVFRDPVTLHCGHTLCAQCVTAYTKTQKQAIAEKSILCAHCRGLTKVPDPTKPVEEWAGQIKTGFFVKGLVEAVVTDNKNDLNDLCASCQEDGETEPAVVWCRDCEHGLCSGCQKYHRRLPMSKDHELIHLSEGSGHTVRRSRKRFPCPKHPDAVIDMICEDCDIAVCHRCCILHHRKCESVIPLEECLPRLKSVLNVHEKELDNVVKKITEELSLNESQVKDVEREAEEAITSIDVREQQKQLKVKVNQAKEETLNNFRSNNKSGNMRLEEAKQRQGLIREAFVSDVPMHCYEMYKICKPSAVYGSEDTKSEEKQNRINMKFVDNSDEITSFMQKRSLVSFGNFGESPVPIGSTSKPTLVKKIETGHVLWDVLVMTVKGMKTVIVTSLTERKMMAFYQRQDQQCTSQLDIARKAYNVTQVSSDKCAVAFHEAKQIQFVSVTPELKLFNTVITSKGYAGLTCLNPTTLAAGTVAPGEVDIIDMSGTILRSFGFDQFSSPCHMAHFTDNIILVSDWYKKSTIGVTDTGEIMFKYPQMQYPRGITCSGGGEIFVADEHANTVVQLTDTGKFVRDVLSAADGLSQPRALFVDDDNLMYVSVDHKTIHVYEFK